MPTKKPPEIRQCQDPEHWQFGSTATAGDGAQQGKWLVGNPATGAHWADDDEVKDWKVMK